MKRVDVRVGFAFSLLIAFVGVTWAQGSGYMTPPAPITQILDSPPTPLVSVDPTRTTIAVVGRANLPPIADFAEGELRLAGYRINPRNNSVANSRVGWQNALSFQSVQGGAKRDVVLPAGTRFFMTRWSPDGSRLAFIADAPDGVDLWVADVASAKARKLVGKVNVASGEGFAWLPDNKRLLVHLVPAGRGKAPNTAQTPASPIVQETSRRAAPAPTYQDLLRNETDAALFTHYFTAQLAIVGTDDSQATLLGDTGIFDAVDVSPNGQYLLQRRLKQSFSYVVPAGLFATDVVVTDLDGKLVHTVANLPVRDDIRPQYDAVAPGPRAIHWRADQAATLVWVEAQDGGDALRQAAIRDRLFTSLAPFTERQTLVDLPERYGTILWGEEKSAIVMSRWWNTRHETRYVIDPSAREPMQSMRKIVERNFQDRYNDPGMPVMRRTKTGHAVMHLTSDRKAVLMTGAGATRAGEFPFLARMELTSGKSERLWQSQAPYFETVAAVIDDAGRKLLTRRETKNEPPNYFVRDGRTSKALTQFPDPAPQFAGVTKQTLSYRRKDGVELSGTLYLPAGYVAARDGRLPVVMWAYPTEYTDAAVAGQVVDTDNRFVRPAGISHLFLLTQGYAVLDDPKMPIVGGSGTEPNDTYVQQLVASAQAAVDAVVELGVADRDRIAVGGHSYGAFMTANLLAHSDLFRTGIARSGAYNRTLTPFGFQAEQRTYWQATETYTNMSPFTHAGKINEPILLIHGEADDNTGTYPVQTERFFAALRGLGGTARYVVLPLEAHGYRARESVMHTQWEMVRWLDLHVKSKTAAGSSGSSR